MGRRKLGRAGFARRPLSSGGWLICNHVEDVRTHLTNTSGADADQPGPFEHHQVGRPTRYA
jgi:hypothetical protein